MSVAMRVRSLLGRHGDSLRKAAQRTGVAAETIRRIANGYEGPSVATHVRKIAQGYGVREEVLLEGMDPRGDFEWTIQHSSPSQRIEFLMMTLQERVQLTLAFLSSKYASSLSRPLLAAASGLRDEDLEAILANWASRVPDATTAQAIANGIHRLTGICLAWFIYGWVEGEPAGKVIGDRFSRVCSQVAHKARRHTAERTKRVLRVAVGLVS